MTESSQLQDIDSISIQSDSIGLDSILSNDRNSKRSTQGFDKLLAIDFENIQGYSEKFQSNRKKENQEFEKMNEDEYYKNLRHHDWRK